MIEEPYRWIEAIKNRRQYIEDQLATGSPVVLMPCAEGLLLVTVTGESRKLFEVYDRIAFAGLGHPADIERMRLAAIDLAHLEGFNRAVNDVSLRRLVSYGMSPALKNAFEQVFSAPFIVKSLLVEIADHPNHDLVVKLDYDGSFGRAGSEYKAAVEVLAGSNETEDLMRHYLATVVDSAAACWDEVLPVALRAWTIGMRRANQSEAQAAEERREEETLSEALLSKRFRELTKQRRVEAALLERRSTKAARFRLLDEKEIRPVLKDL